MKSHLSRLLSLFLLFSLLASCSPQPVLNDFHSAWRYSDLRLLDEPGAGPAGSDIAAVYLRTEREDFQVRLDFVDLSGKEDYEVDLYIDVRPGGRPLPDSLFDGAFEWDTQITWDSRAMTVLQAGGSETPGLKARAERSLSQDSLVFSLDAASLGLNRGGASVFTAVYDREQKTVLDSAGPARTGDSPPSPAPVLLAFWGTMPATTPSQAARAWNGAHTGPFNDRHGLYQLLRAVEASKLPVTLLDLKTPEALSALYYAGGDLIDSVVRQGLAYLPDNVSASSSNPLFAPDPDIQKRSLEASRQAGVDFRLPRTHETQGILSAPAFPEALLSGGSEPARVVFTHDGEASDSALVRCGSWQQSTVIALPSMPVSATLQMANKDGPTVAFKRDLLAAAQTLGGETGITDPCQAAIAFLGGDLSRSALGDPEVSRTTLAYLASHPWIRPLKPPDFITSNPELTYQPTPFVQPPDTPVFSVDGTPTASGLTLLQLQDEVLKQLKALPEGRLSEAARKMYTALLAPVNATSGDIYRLNAGYLGQVGLLLAGASWEARQPDRAWSCYDEAVCSRKVDVDWDDEPETLLASDSYLAIIEPHGGYLAALFARDESGVHQIVAPGWQFMTGFSDPSTWRLDHGPASEPGAWRGAFSDVPAGFIEPSWQMFAQKDAAGGVTFTSPDGSVVKTYTLTQDGLEVKYQSQGTVSVLVPLAVDTWNRFGYQWWEEYAVEAVDSGWSFRSGGYSVDLKAEAAAGNQIKTTMRSFLDPLPMLDQPEDPFIDYGPAYFYPFPMALVEARLEGEVRFWIGAAR